MKTALLRAFGAFACAIGVVLIGGVVYVAAGATASQLVSAGFLVLPFVFSFALLMVTAGFRLAVRGQDALRRSLAPRWALYLSGIALLGSLAGLAVASFGTPKGGAQAMGLTMLGAIALSWLREARGSKGAG